METILKARNLHFKKTLNDQIEPYALDFRHILGKLFIEEKGKWFSSGLVLYGYERIVSQAFPNLAAHIENDKDGLVNLDYLLNEFDYLSQGIFKKKDSNLCVIAHPFFRRALSIHNNFHWLFLDELISMHGQENIRIKLKLDMDFLGYAPSFIPVHEFEYWWGPKYDDDITAIPPGLTQYGSDEFERQYYQIDRTEFVWKHEENLYTLELEEVKDEPAPTIKDIYGCRYVHAIWDTRKKGFDHFDGATRSYDMELMLERVSKKMTEMGRRSEYTKLFRIDGNLPLSNWKSLVTNYLQGNPQIYEYFGLPKPGVQAVIEPEHEPTVLERYVPYSINKGDGIRLYVSYHAKETEQTEGRYFSSNDVLTMANGPLKAVEFITVDVVKIFERKGISISLPKDCNFVLHEDYYHNIPCISHDGANIQGTLNGTFSGFKELVEVLVREEHDHVVSLSMAWNWEDRKVNVALMGHVDDLNKWFKATSMIPIERARFKIWLEQQGKYIKANGTESRCPALASVICDDGMLYLHRRLVRQDAEMNWPDLKKPMEPIFNIPKEKTDLIEALQQELIYATPSLIIKKMLCVKTGLDYKLSPYCILLDKGVNQLMDDVEMIAFHWTDKPRPISFADED